MPTVELTSLPARGQLRYDALMASRERISPVDAAWLRMDRPTNPMMITAVLQLEGDVPFEDVRRGIGERLLANPRFRQRVVPSRVPFALASWEEDDRFSLDAHVKRVTLGGGRDDAALRALVSELMSTPLERDRPLWDAHVVEGGKAGTVIVTRIHHAVGDGVALVKVLLGVSEGDGEREEEEPRSQAPAIVGVARASERGLLAVTARAASQIATAIRLVAIPADHPSALKGDLGPRKRAAWSKPIPLERIRSIAHQVGGKVNDVLLAAVAGGTRAYLASGDEQAGATPLRALVPMYVRGKDDAMGNHFGLVFVDLPEDGAPLDRVRVAKERMDVIKNAPDAIVAMKVLGALGLASPTVERIGVDFFTGKATLLVTNVPGPTQRVRLFGGRLASLMVWAPVSGSVGITVTLISYAGEVRMGVGADVRRLGAPEALVAAFEADLEAIERAATGRARPDAHV